MPQGPRSEQLVGAGSLPWVFKVFEEA